MNKYEEFEAQYEKEKPMFKEWGYCVKNHIIENLNLPKAELDKIIKMDVEPRVKDTASILQKAFFRGKNYQNPYNEITDKVGIRFVVMIVEQIHLIENIIEKADIWKYSKDKDFQEESKSCPQVFGYESVHYIVRNIHTIDSNGIIIKKGTPCEIQIRTLEQHAYAEISHDYFYKNNLVHESIDKMNRYLARSMALNETTDFLFGEVYNMIEAEKEKYYKVNTELMSIMEFRDYDESLNMSIYKNIENMIKEYIEDISEVKMFIDDDIKENIVEKKTRALFRQPMVLLLYYLISEHRTEILQIWDGTVDVLEPIYSDLGYSMQDIY